MRSVADQLLYGLVASAFMVLAALPRRLAYWLGGRLGDLVYLCLRSRRRVTLENLALALQTDTTHAAQCRIARAVFQNQGRHLIDFSRLWRITPQRFGNMCTVEGLEHITELLSRRAGLLIISGHCGSWELASAVALQLDTPMHIIVRPLDHPVFHRLVDTYRQRCGYQAIPRHHAMTASLQALRRGEIVCVLMDQSSLRSEGIPVEFFGVPAYTTTGPALLALRARCPVINGFMICQEDGRHRLVFSREIPVCRTGNLRHDIAETTRTFTQTIEAHVRRYPEQWFWVHRRWKRR
jgi:Kdo2-lipid IVA lauroyltransferase/acyltransferase